MKKIFVAFCLGHIFFSNLAIATTSLEIGLYEEPFSEDDLAPEPPFTEGESAFFNAYLKVYYKHSMSPTDNLSLLFEAIWNLRPTDISLEEWRAQREATAQQKAVEEETKIYQEIFQKLTSLTTPRKESEGGLLDQIPPLVPTDSLLAQNNTRKEYENKNLKKNLNKFKTQGITPYRCSSAVDSMNDSHDGISGSPFSTSEEEEIREPSAPKGSYDTYIDLERDF